jgi:hypothetical protein
MLHETIAMSSESCLNGEGASHTPVVASADLLRAADGSEGGSVG